MRPWNIRILAYDPYVPDYRFLEAQAKPVDLETLLHESDVVTMHVVLNKETRHMMSYDQFAMMKPRAFFINTSRGAAHDEKALADALERGLIAGAALNAFEDEPLPADSSLRLMGNRILMRPHGGTPLRSNLASSEAPVGRTAGQNTQWVNTDIMKALRGELPVHIFNHEAIPLWLERFGGKPAGIEAPLPTP